VRVQAAHPWYFVAEALFGEYLWDAVFENHPSFVAMPQAMRGQACLDGQPAGQRQILRDRTDTAADRGTVVRVRAGPRLDRGPGRDWYARPCGGVGDDDACRAACGGFMPAVARWAEHAAGVVAAPVVAAVGAEENVPAGAAVRRRAGTSRPEAVLGLHDEQAGEEVG
jgi:hypothetical protein